MALAKIIPTLLIILSVHILSFLIERKENNALDLNIDEHKYFNVLSCERFDQGLIKLIMCFRLLFINRHQICPVSLYQSVLCH